MLAHMPPGIRDSVEAILLDQMHSTAYLNFDPLESAIPQLAPRALCSLSPCFHLSSVLRHFYRNAHRLKMCGNEEIGNRTTAFDLTDKNPRELFIRKLLAGTYTDGVQQAYPA